MKPIKSIIKIVLLIPFLSGCTTAPPQNQYKIEQQSGARILKINSQNGDTWELINGEFIKIPNELTSTLQAGKKYYIENNQSVIYLGNGKFSEPKKDYERLWK